MANRERNRYILGEIISERGLREKSFADRLLGSYKQVVLGMWGEQALGDIVGATKIVVAFGELGGHFIARVPTLYFSKALAAFSALIDVSSQPVTVRVLFVSGRLKIVATEAMHRILSWRHNLSADFALSRKEYLDVSVEKAIATIASLPTYSFPLSRYFLF